MQKYSKMALLLVGLALFTLAGCAGMSAPGTNNARNIIFMVPDGMGLADVTAARIYLGRRLTFETLEQIGYQKTSSANSTVTDSAAAASAWASGEKFRNGQISCRDRDGDYRCDEPLKPTILEIAKSLGKATGLVVTSTVSHATPAAWAAHVHNRKCETEIFRQYIQETGVDVILGGGIGPDKAGSCFTPSALQAGALRAMARSRYGYTLVSTREELAGAAQKSNKLLGLFAKSGKTPELFRIDKDKPYPDKEPTLAEMTKAALQVLERSDKGFFLLVEGSQIDWGNHGNDAQYQLAEILGFEAAVGQVLDWIARDPRRAAQTLLVVVADHETGGFAINGPYGKICPAGQLVATAWTTDEHTAQDTLIWSTGPGSELLGRALDNTDLYGVITSVMR